MAVDLPAPGAGPAVAVRGATVTYRGADHPAVEQADLEVRRGEVLALLGPSGSGKSTLLRAVAGLEPLQAGSVLLDGRSAAATPVHRRGVGFMFQDYALFPHRNVQENVAFGLRMQRASRADVQRRVAEVLQLVGLVGASSRSVTSLSGGEQQRVALARALAPRPKVLLLDEPLGSLDRDLRQRLMGELGVILAQLDVATIYVTHDQEEAFSLGDRLAIMSSGRVVRSGTPEDVWSHPGSRFVASFLGLGTLVAAAASPAGIVTPWGAVLAGPGSAPSGSGGRATVLIRPSAVHVSSTGPIEGVVSARRFVGGAYELNLTTDFGVVSVTHPPGQRPPSLGERVRIEVDSDDVEVIDDGVDP